MLVNVKVPVLSQASTSAVLWWLIASVGKSTEPQPGLENLLSSVLLSPQQLVVVWGCLMLGACWGCELPG